MHWDTKILLKCPLQERSPLALLHGQFNLEVTSSSLTWTLFNLKRDGLIRGELLYYI
jgi:hypothetical protein